MQNNYSFIFPIRKIDLMKMLMTFSMWELPHGSNFCHITKKMDTSAFLEGKMGVMTKITKNMIV